MVLLDHFGIKSAMTYGDQTSMPVLQQYLGDGRKVIAWVNSTIIGDQTGNSTDQRTKADHYVEVTAIDTNNQIVHLSDPGVDHADEQIPVATFTNAWGNRAGHDRGHRAGRLSPRRPAPLWRCRRCSASRPRLRSPIAWGRQNPGN